MAGPVGAIVGGVGAAVAAQQKGGVGDATRATGMCALCIPIFCVST